MFFKGQMENGNKTFAKELEADPGFPQIMTNVNY